MISRAILQAMRADPDVAAIAGSNMFAERGSGTPIVIFKSTTTAPIDVTIPKNMRTAIQVMADGFGIEPGEHLLILVGDKLADLEGKSLQVLENGGTVQYDILSVVHRNGPAIVENTRSDTGSSRFTSNFSIYYRRFAV